jgi:predicted nucleic acid-binding protein
VTSAFVVDASVAVAWVHPDQASPESDACLDAMVDGAELFVPAVWPLEVANALTVLTRRSKLTVDEGDAARGWLKQLRVRVDHEGSAVAFTALPTLATRFAVSIYDAAYLELAARRKLPLGCKDGPLRAAAKRHGITLIS